MDLDKVVRLGTKKSYNGRSYSIYCHIKFKGRRLSICGVEGPLASGSAIGGCGQIDSTLREQAFEIRLAPKWTRPMLQQFLDIWDRWHLNDMKAGTPEQMAELERRKADFPGYPVTHYDWACKVLKEANLYAVRTGREVVNAMGKFVPETYVYGTAWLTEELPQEVIDFLAELPETDKEPAWV